MSRRLRLASAPGAKRGLRSAALGILVAASFRIREGLFTHTVDFANVLNENAMCVHITMKDLDKGAVMEKLGPYLNQDKSEGCIGPGVALPWLALRQLLGWDFCAKVYATRVTYEGRRAWGAAERLGTPVKLIYKILKRRENIKAIGDWKAADFLRDCLLAKIGFTSKGTDDALLGPSEKIILARDRSSCDEPRCALSDFQVYYLGALEGSQLTAAEKLTEANLSIARCLNDALNTDRVDETLWNAIESTEPHLCLEAVLSKIWSKFDADLLKRFC